MFKSFKKTVNNSSYLSFSSVLVGLSVVIILTGLTVGLRLLNQTQDLRQQAVKSKDLCSWCGTNCKLISRQERCIAVQPPADCTCSYDHDLEECVKTCKELPPLTSRPTERPRITITPTSTPEPSPTRRPTPTNVPTLEPIAIPSPTAEPDPSPTLSPEPTELPEQLTVYSVVAEQADELVIYPTPDLNDPNQSITLKIVNQYGQEQTVNTYPECSNSSCLYRFYPMTNPQASNFWLKWKPEEDIDVININSDHWQVEGISDPYDGSWVVATNPCSNLSADFDQNCSVDSSDRSFLINRIWGTTADDLKADITGPNGVADNKVDIWDYAALVNQWTGQN